MEFKVHFVNIVFQNVLGRDRNRVEFKVFPYATKRYSVKIVEIGTEWNLKSFVR